MRQLVNETNSQTISGHTSKSIWHSFNAVLVTGDIHDRNTRNLANPSLQVTVTGGNNVTFVLSGRRYEQQQQRQLNFTLYGIYLVIIESHIMSRAHWETTEGSAKSSILMHALGLLSTVHSSYQTMKNCNKSEIASLYGSQAVLCETVWVLVDKSWVETQLMPVRVLLS